MEILRPFNIEDKDIRIISNLYQKKDKIRIKSKMSEEINIDEGVKPNFYPSPMFIFYSEKICGRAFQDSSEL